jgi:tetratricopeptide (TPR) repeat protein
VRKSGNRVRITGLLVEAESGAQLWADKFDGALDDVFDLQDQITASVVGAIEPSLRQAEVERARRKRPDSLDAWDLVLRALPHVTANSQAEVEIALPLLEQALALDPSYAEAHGYKAWCHEQRFRLTHQPDDATAALHHARLALSHGVQESTPLALGGFVVGYVQGDLPAGLSALEQALAINPNSALALGFASCLSTFAGELEKAREQAERALRLSPLDAFRALPHVAIAIGEFLLGRYATAAAAAVKSAQANPGFGPAHLMLVAARARLGQLDDARAGASRILAAEPKFRVLAFTQNFGRVTQRQDWAEALRSALLEAGLPE